MSLDRSDPDAAPSIGIRRFRDWRRLREWLVRQTPLAGPGHPVERLQIVVPGPGSAWVLDRTLRALLPGDGSFPEIRLPGTLFADLAGDLDPPLRPAPPLVREVLMEEALIREEMRGAPAPTEGTPAPPAPGDFGQLADRFLPFLDEVAADSTIDPDAASFDRFVQRVERSLAEAGETDGGAPRLLALAGRLRRVHADYRRTLGDAARVDPGGLRERLLTVSGAFRPRFGRTRVIALGENALRPADLQLLGALLPPGAVVWALPEGAPLPGPPRGVTFRDDRGEDGGTSPPLRRVQPTLFSPPAASPAPAMPPAVTARPPAILVPAVESSAAEGDQGFAVFETTDREAEARLAVSLLVRFRDRWARDFRGYHRCAFLARQPGSYLDAVEVALAERGIALATPLQPVLTRHPWVASVADVLEFAARPGRISLGLNLLRTPFLKLPDLSGTPPRAADVLAGELLRTGCRDTNGPEELDRIAERLDQTAEQLLRALETIERPAAGPGLQGPADRQRERAGRLRAAAGTLAQLSRLAVSLRPLRDETAAFREAAETLARFLETHFDPPDEQIPDVRDTVLQALRQAAAAAPADARAGGGLRFRHRIRRLLNHRSVARGPGGRGVHLIAAGDAPFGDYDFIALLGMVDADWPGPRPGNIFFPNHLLAGATRTRHGGSRDREIRLLRSLPALPACASAFLRPQLDDGFPVARSALEVELSEAVAAPSPGYPLLPASGADVSGTPPEDVAAEPLASTLDRTSTAAAVLDGPLSPTALDTYAKSPAQFFARYVLRLDEERPLTDVPPPTERGELLHAFLERAYPALEGAGLAIDVAGLDEVLSFLRDEYRRFAAARNMSATDRKIEEAWLFGSHATPAAMEWFLREEVARGPAAVDRIEEWVAGDVEGIPIRGRLDRVDRLAGGSRRVVEYKSGRYYEKPLQARLYARVLESGGETPTSFAIPYFGNRRWIGPEDDPNDAEQDARIIAIREGLARGDFSLPYEDGRFDFHLVVRRDLGDLPRGDSNGARGEPRDGSGGA
ncbi:MAG: PD-(D/E)XK nuclease family protein [Acidobacteriota bacterium]|nr:PD-(D/E)XK nuclease family protein [Acidobacteriota bacterium]